MRTEPWKRELIDALRMLKQRRFDEIDVGRMLQLAEWCFGEGELLCCLVFLKTARCAHRSVHGP